MQKMDTEHEVVDSSPAQVDGETSRADPSLPRRCRRQTTFYEPDQPTPKKALQIEKGEGVQLKAIPSVSAQLAKWKADEPLLLELHRILYKRTGTRARRKRDIGEFSGFVFTQTEHQQENQSLKHRVASVKNLRKLIDLFNLSQKTGKEKMVTAIVEFLMKPEDKTNKPAIETKTTSKKKTKPTVVTTKKRTKTSELKKQQSKRRKLSSTKKKKKKQLREDEAGDDPAEEAPKDKDQS